MRNHMSRSLDLTIKGNRSERPSASNRWMPSLMMSIATLGMVLCLSANVNAQRFQQTNLVSDVPGMAAVTDPNLVNPWGLARSSTSPWWVADNGTGLSTLYTGADASTMFELMRGAFFGKLLGPDSQPITLDGLWALAFGNGGNAGPTNALFFTAGIDDEDHGLFWVKKKKNHPIFFFYFHH